MLKNGKPDLTWEQFMAHARVPNNRPATQTARDVLNGELDAPWAPETVGTKTRIGMRVEASLPYLREGEFKDKWKTSFEGAGLAFGGHITVHVWVNSSALRCPLE